MKLRTGKLETKFFFCKQLNAILFCRGCCVDEKNRWISKAIQSNFWREAHEELLNTRMKDEVWHLGSRELFLPASETKGVREREGAGISLEQLASSHSTFQPLSSKTKPQCLKIEEKKGSFVPWCLETLVNWVFFSPRWFVLYEEAFRSLQPTLTNLLPSADV